MSREKVYDKDNLPQPNMDKKGNAFKDLSNKNFGKLTALYPVNKTKDNKWQWLCRCECGRYTLVRGNYLSSGHTTSCGCYNAHQRVFANLEDISGQIFKNLQVLSYSHSQKEHPYFLCKCLICGQEKAISKDAILRGQNSCGCCQHKSSLEEKAEEILKEYKINYIREFTFKDLIGKNNNKLRFDFAIFNENNQLIRLIEIQGPQHYKNIYKLSQEDFEYSLLRDKMKKEYCLKNNIILNCIRYDEEISYNRLMELEDC